MITTKDQDDLFRLLAEYIGTDVVCVAIGGTAMMYLGYKTATKDIDLVFASARERRVFVAAIEELGYRERSVVGVYDGKRTKHEGRPLMFTRGQERFDLFVGDVFGMKVEVSHVGKVERRDFLGRHGLTILLLPIEELILLKAVTRRDRDHDDIESIVRVEKLIDWEHIIDKAIERRKENPWVLIDLEETMQGLRKLTFLPERLFKKIYAAQQMQEWGR